MHFPTLRVSASGIFELRDRLASDDEALLAFAMDWLKFSLYGMKTMTLK